MSYSKESLDDELRKDVISAEFLQRIVLQIAAVNIVHAVGGRVAKFIPWAKLMYHITKIYKKTRLSLIVTRSKKYIKHFQQLKHLEEHHDEPHSEHQNGNH